MANVVLTRGMVALVDDGDVDQLAWHRWHATPGWQGHTWYAAARTGGRTLYMHRLIMDAPKGVEVDHINGDGLDNRRDNLRLVTKSQQARNAPPHRDTISGYKGVTWHNASGLWHASIRISGHTESLGYYRTAIEAAQAYNARAQEVDGIHASLNAVPAVDPRHPWRTTPSRADILAMVAAQGYLPHPEPPRGGHDAVSRYRGVGWNKKLGRWTAQARVKKISIYLGLYTTEEDAARAYNSFVRAVYGPDAWINDL